MIKRLFIAISLPDEIRRELAAVSNYFRHPAVRWIPPENLHITVHFIGNIALSETEKVASLTLETVSQISPFNMITHLLTLKKRSRKPAMIWVTFEESEDFKKLVSALQIVLPGDKSKPALPHVTLARINGEKLRELPAFPALKRMHVEVNEIVLFESVLGDGFPVYKRVESFEFHR